MQRQFQWGYAMRASAASSTARSPPSSTLPTAAETTARGQGAESREPPLSSPKASTKDTTRPARSKDASGASTATPSNSNCGVLPWKSARASAVRQQKIHHQHNHLLSIFPLKHMASSRWLSIYLLPPLLPPQRQKGNLLRSLENNCIH